MIKVSTLKLNPNNPRRIEKERVEKLRKSIHDFPKMMELRPLIVDESNTVLGGNMRLQAIKQLGYKEIPDEWVKRAEDLSEEQKREFIIKDNVGFGEWDWELLSNEWDAGKLAEWGLDVSEWNTVDYSTKNKEIDTDEFEDKCTITLNYTLEEYEQVKTALHKIAQTPEEAVWQLLNL